MTKTVEKTISEHCFERYQKEIHRVRGSWQTHPPHRKAVLDRFRRSFILAYAAVCVLEKLRGHK